MRGLIRYEQLRLDGATAAANIALTHAAEVEDRVRRNLDVNLSTTTATLAMPALVGEVDLAPPDPDPRLESLWRAAPEDRGTVWDRLRKAGNTASLRRELQLGLLRRAAENPCAQPGEGGGAGARDRRSGVSRARPKPSTLSCCSATWPCSRPRKP